MLSLHVNKSNSLILLLLLQLFSVLHFIDDDIKFLSIPGSVHLVCFFDPHFYVSLFCGSVIRTRVGRSTIFYFGCSSKLLEWTRARLLLIVL